MVNYGLHVGQCTTVHLPGVADAGYLWEFAIAGNVEAVTVVLGREVSGPDTAIKKSADEIATIEARHPGTAIIRFLPVPRMGR